ncbi:NADase-type glycan-binding domain-containing protein [Leptospira yasudae]|uniref:NAD glycohydrolase translocation F5/8 type C domain-containing protein n=1 Tax=Leptospira yasudae TaxID=2202201 RepID=A0ABX9LZI4_9LEPT|nr:hypothetical protein [Leptospira yasudae]RHX78301.1 hypothetical protein DLM77_17880 [Leptospira yasudae]
MLFKLDKVILLCATSLMKKTISFIFLFFLFFPSIHLYAEEGWNRLYVSNSTASSYLKNNWNRYEENYHPNYAFDDNPETAWVEGKDGYGNGESITWPISSLGTANSLKLKIRNGYHKSNALLESNSAPKKIKISVWNEPDQLVVEKDFELKKTKDWQELVISIPNQAGIKSLRLMIIDTIPGKVYQDTCISDIQTYIKSDVPYQKKLEEKKKQDLKNWIVSRLKTARYFASLPAVYPFASTRFENKSSEGKNLNIEKEISEKTKILSLLQNDQKQYRMIESKNDEGETNLELPDGIYEFYYIPFLNIKGISFFESNEQIKEVKNPERSGGGLEIYRSNAKLKMESIDSRNPSEIYFFEKTVEEGRNVYETEGHVLISFLEGKIVSILKLGQSQYTDYKGTDKKSLVEYIKIFYDKKEKINRLEKHYKTRNGFLTNSSIAIQTE